MSYALPEFPAPAAITIDQSVEHHGVMLFGGWLKNLPYLNLIENLWAQMKHKQRKKQATSAERLKRIARKV